jgi:hypothetical protein
MHIENDKGVNVAALTCGLNVTDDLIKAWGQGGVELYHELSDWADIVTTEEGILAMLLEEQDEGWPGVFVYEVTEELGAHLRPIIMADDAVTKEYVLTKTRELVCTFCRSASNTERITAMYLRLSGVGRRP